jgi:sugar/nucleoside kinase (ribokinase family)
VIPVGRVGDDDNGRILYDEMTETGFVMDHVEKMPGVSTLFSFCFYYPDGSGGNLTTDNSASSMVDPFFIEKASEEIIGLGSKGIIVAAPEVPVESRIKLLELGKKYGSFCSASFTSQEIREAVESGLTGKIDYIAINIDEASALADEDHDKTNKRAVVLAAIHKLQKSNKSIMVSVTGGREGSWCWDGKNLNYFQAIETKAVSTAGAGDAFFSGMLTGLALGLHIFEAQQLASLIAALSVTSPDTIHKGIDRSSLRKFLSGSGTRVSEKVVLLLND